MSDILAFVDGDRGLVSFLAFINVSRVYESDATGTIKVVPAPEDLVAWFHRNPYLQAGQPEPVSVGGVSGVQFDLVVEDLPQDYYAECGVGCVDLFSTNELSSFSLSEDEALGSRFRSRVIILKDVKGDTVVILINGPSAEFYDFLPNSSIHKY
jgi:hypothetical protein